MILIAMVGVVVPSSSARVAGIDLRIDFETGDASQLSGLECPHPATQFQVYAAGAPGLPAPRQGTHAVRFSESAADVWPGNGMVRCLGARYDSRETTGDDYYYGFSVLIPAAGLRDNLIWELHHPSSLYSLPGCGVAPFALLSVSGGLQFRISTGNCTVGAGYAYWAPHLALPGLQAVPRSTWIDFLVHITFSETSGTVELTYRVGDAAWPAAPQLTRYGIPTMPFAAGANVHDVRLYTELGLYTGYSPYVGSDSVFLDGYRRGSSADVVRAEFPGGSPPPASPPVIAQSVAAGQTLRGVVEWTATPSAPVRQIVFALDGNRTTYTDTSAPYSWTLDTATLANGTHALGLTVTLLDGTVVWQPYQVGSVTVDNAVIPPASSVPPAISGVAVDGATLTATAGTWTNAPTALAYGWEARADAAAPWSSIAGATSSTLVVTDALVGAQVRVVVSASNAAGSAFTTSAATATVAPPVIVQNIVAGQILSGVVTWSAVPSVPIRQVVFALDSNRITVTDTSPPFTYVLDTTRLGNGTHTLGLTVTLLNGTVVWQPYQIGAVTVLNPGP